MKIETARDAYTFLAQSTFGGTREEIDALVGGSASEWVSAQFDVPFIQVTEDLAERYAMREQTGESLFAQMHVEWWGRFLHADDQLRQRTTFALSQLLVKSETTNEPFLRNMDYIDILNRHAFGNYEDLLYDITYSPGMGQFLTYVHSARANDRTGRSPDENYAREIMQLFSIGLVELNMDGTPKLGTDGQPIETYDNEDIEGLARVFTGFKPANVPYIETFYRPMRILESNYEAGEKTFLGHTIAADTPADDNIREAIGVLIAHDNFPPFIARQMIQRFTQSDPAPDYVERVATAFANGEFVAEDGIRYGEGRRGDMKALISAIVLDRQFFDTVPARPGERKLREPILRLAHMLRAVEFANDDPAIHRYTFSRLGRRDQLGMAPQQASSVFNYYRPGFIARGAETGAAGMTAPELQLQTPDTIRTYGDVMARFLFAGSGNGVEETDPFLPKLGAEVALQDNPDALIDHLAALLVNGKLNDTTRARIKEALLEMPVRDDDRYRDRDALARARLAIWFVVTSTDFAIVQ